MAIQYGEGDNDDILVEKTKDYHIKTGEDENGENLYEPQPRPDNLRIKKNVNIDNGGVFKYALYEGSQQLSISSLAAKADYFNLIHKISTINLPASPAVAMLGAATMIVPPILDQLVDWDVKHLYELHQEIKDWNTEIQPDRDDGWTWYIGDCYEKMDEHATKYHLIINDTGYHPSEAEIAILEAHLKSGGLIMNYYDQITIE